MRYNEDPAPFLEWQKITKGFNGVLFKSIEANGVRTSWEKDLDSRRLTRTDESLMSGHKRSIIAPAWIGPYFRFTDAVNGVPRVVTNDGESDKINVELSVPTFGVQELSLGYQANGCPEYISIETRPVGNDPEDIVCMPEDQRLRMLLLKTPKKNLETLWDMFIQKGSQVFSVAPIDETHARDWQDVYENVFLHSKTLGWSDEDRDYLRKFVDTETDLMAKHLLPGKRHDSLFGQFAEGLALWVKNSPDLPQSLKSLPSVQQLEKFYLALSLSCIKIINFNYEQTQEARQYRALINFANNKPPLLKIPQKGEDVRVPLGEPTEFGDYTYTVTSRSPDYQISIARVSSSYILRATFPQHVPVMPEILDSMRDEHSHRWQNIASKLPMGISIGEKN